MRGRGDLAHQGIDLASGNRHNDSLNSANLFVRNVLCLGHAKVVFDSWLTFPGHGRSQSDHCRSAGIEMLLVADDIVEITVGFMLFGWQHDAKGPLFKIMDRSQILLYTGTLPDALVGLVSHCELII